MVKHPLSYYIERFQNNTLTESEAAEFLELLQLRETENELDLIMDEDFRQWEKSSSVYPEMKNRVHTFLREQIETPVPKTHSPVVRKMRWYSAAAAIILLFGVSVYYYRSVRSDHSYPRMKEIADFAAPNSSRATITLADGKTLFVDSINAGQIAQINNVQLVKLDDGQIVYKSSDIVSHDRLQYNTLTNPRGSNVIDIQLSDGSHVWLNAGSSITYPIAFSASQRDVELKGEGYFEIAKIPGNPFKVKINNTEIEVLGTHFNVNGYVDERVTRTTLFEGSVRIHAGNQQKLLAPGEQVVAEGNNITIRKKINTEEVIAWKDGVFLFDDQSVESIMRQLSRWYDVNWEYKGAPIPELFTAKISRKAPLSKVLSFLEKTGHIKFSVRGKKVIVEP